MELGNSLPSVSSDESSKDKAHRYDRMKAHLWWTISIRALGQLKGTIHNKCRHKAMKTCTIGGKPYEEIAPI